eukprot:358363-Chlamydomonas_euryale.AAC.6
MAHLCPRWHTFAPVGTPLPQLAHLCPSWHTFAPVGTPLPQLAHLCTIEEALFDQIRCQRAHAGAEAMAAKVERVVGVGACERKDGVRHLT